MGESLDALFRPRRVAVWGASASDPSKLGNTLLRNSAAVSTVAVSAVHPAADEIDGHPASSDPPAGLDLALISLPSPAVESAVVQAAAAGAGAAIVLASGFGEAGADGVERQRRITEIAGEAGMRLVGPNCMGIVSALGDDWLNATYFWSVPLRRGPIGFISQSGAFGGVFFDQLKRRQLGMSRFASVGNSADVNETDVIEWLAADDATDVIGVFCEAITGGRRFVDAVRAATAIKPVVVLKSGKSASGARASSGHTGALTSDHVVAQAVFRRAGAIEAATTDEFFDLLHAAACSASSTPAGDRVAVITVSGGPSVLAADTVEAIGMRLPEPDDATRAAIAPHVPHFAALANPFDLTPQCPPESFAPAVEAIYASGVADRVVVIDCGIDSEQLAAAVVDAQREHTLPTTAFLLDTPTIAARFAAAGIGVFASAEAAVRAHRIGQQRPVGQPNAFDDASERVASERAARGGLRGRGTQQHGTQQHDAHDHLTPLSETASKRRLGAAARLPRELTSDDPQAIAEFVAVDPAGRYVAKASGVAHKTEGNLVRLGLSGTDVLASFDELAAAGDGSVVVAEYIDADIELLVGGVRDASFGPVITIGAGGIAAEAAPDVAAVLAPAAPGEIAAAIERLRIAPVLAGWRGGAALDVDALGVLVDAVAAQFDDPSVVEVDVNPVAVVDGRPIVLDALVVVDDRHEHDGIIR